MANITFSKDINGLHITINGVQKDIIILKYEYGSCKPFYFANNGNNIEVKDKKERNYTINKNFEDGMYTFYLVYEDGTYEVTSIVLNELKDVLDYKSYHNIKPMISFTNKMPLNIDKMIEKVNKIGFVYSNVVDDRNVIDVLMEDKLTITSITKFKNIFINDLLSNNITLKNNNFLLKKEIDQNLLNNYLYAVCIIDNKNNIIAVADFIEPILIDNLNTDINLSFSYKD